MSAQVWLIFCAACAILFALPSALAFNVASYRAIRGKKTMIASISGGAIGVVTAMTGAAILVAAASYLPESFFDVLQWAGTGWLMLFSLWTIATPAARTSNADNDNLRGKSNGTIFLDCYKIAALRPRYFSFFMALLLQFVGDSRDSIERLAQMQAIVLVLALVCLTAQALFARSTISLTRSMSATKKTRRARRTHFISGRAVSAGYRRIAA